MNVLLADEVFSDLGEHGHFVRVIIRLTVAMILGGLIGIERQYEHKSAGIRTHMLVALGAALFTLVPLEAKMNPSDVSRVIQGIAAGIGFLGAGTIFKLTDQAEVKGLTSAACIWITAAVGTAVGAGFVWPAIVTVLLSWVILYLLHYVEHWLKHRQDANRLPK
jgi:putative Mg2+ transporter-C (MgtC) family protein